MSSWPSSETSNMSVTLTTPDVQAGQTLLGGSSAYFIQEFIGEGCFGKVAKCQNLKTNETVAVKILKMDPDLNQDTKHEVSMLKMISALNPDRCNLVRFFEHFQHIGQTCLVFEMLDKSLYDLLSDQGFELLQPNEIRPIAKQLLVALDALQGLGILHTDIKPDNIMLVSVQESLQVRLIDFGEAIPTSQACPGMLLQPVGYRAPEVALGLPFTEAIDMWGLGCVLAFLYLAAEPFPVYSDYQMMKCMVEVLGQPEDHMLHSGLYSGYFFVKEEAAEGTRWRLMTPEEFLAANEIEVEELSSFEQPGSLDELVDMHPRKDTAEDEDMMAFVTLLKQMLHLDGDQRVSPQNALQHPFITMSHLMKRPDSSEYLTSSQTLMRFSSMEEPADRQNIPAASELDQEPTAEFDVADEDCGISDEETCIWSQDEATVCCSDEDSCFTDEEPATTPSYEFKLIVYSDDEGISSGRKRSPGVSDGATEPAAASASPHPRKFLQRVSTYLCCCWHVYAES